MLLNATSCGKLARRGMGIFSPRGPNADRNDPPAVNTKIKMKK